MKKFEKYGRFLSNIEFYENKEIKKNTKIHFVHAHFYLQLFVSFYSLEKELHSLQSIKIFTLKMGIYIL